MTNWFKSWMFPLVKMAQIFPPLLAPPLKRIKMTMNNPWCQSDKILKGSFISMLYVRTWYIMIIFHESCKEGHFTRTISVPAPGNSFFALFPRCAALAALPAQVSGPPSSSGRYTSWPRAALTCVPSFVLDCKFSKKYQFQLSLYLENKKSLRILLNRVR